MTKTCSKCGEVKELNMFGKRKEGANGLSAFCKKCKAIVMYKYRQKNIVKLREREKELYYISHEENKSKSRENRAKNVNVYRETNKAWYNKNKVKIREVSNRYRKSRGDFFKVITKQWHLDHPESKKNMDAKRIENITNGYLLNLVSGSLSLAVSERKLIPIEYLELKRTQILLKRQIKSKIKTT